MAEPAALSPDPPRPLHTTTWTWPSRSHATKVDRIVREVHLRAGCMLLLSQGAGRPISLLLRGHIPESYQSTCHGAICCTRSARWRTDDERADAV